MEVNQMPTTIIESRFLDHIYDGYQAGQRYCFILGAGASVSSGIRSGTELMKEWHDYLSQKGHVYISDCAQSLGLDNSAWETLFVPGYASKSADYFTLFDLRFAGQPNVAYAALEREMEGKCPSFGYFSLAMLLSNTENRFVISTNFDSLVEDALFFYTEKHPLVVGHESLASFLSSECRHPIVAKLHRDLLLRPKNRKTETDRLAEEWKAPLRSALSRYTPIVIGYAGGDRTLMALLDELQLSGLYWCYRDHVPEAPVCETVLKNNGHLVKIRGFDEILFQLGERFQDYIEDKDPCAAMQEQTERRCRHYEESFSKVKGNYESKEIINDGDSTMAAAENNADATVPEMNRYERILASKTKAIALNPDNAEAYRSRGVILHNMNRLDEALADKTKAIALDPDNATLYYSRGITLHKVKRYNEALTDKSQAIALEPQNADFYNSRGITLHALKHYDEALTDMSQAIELDPQNANFYKTRGVILHALKHYDEALTDKSQAIELEPQNADFYKTRGVTLHALKRYDGALTDKSQAIALDPQNAAYFDSRSATLHALERYEEALVDSNKAVELSPKSEEYLRSRAVTLRAMGRTEEAARDEATADTLSAKK